MTDERKGIALVLAFALFAPVSMGCDKVKGLLGTKGDAGETSSGGLFGSLFGTDFEGEITANVTSKTALAASAPMQLVFGINKPKYRIDMGGGPATAAQLPAGGSMILDPPAKKGWLLVPSQKTAMVLDFEKLKAQSKGGVPSLPGQPKPTTPSVPPKIDKTGKKDVVAGYACEIWNITAEGKRAEACVAEGITWIDLTDLGFGSPELTLTAIATEANRFPLRVVAYDAKGAEETRMEVVKVDKKKLDDARFVVPADYRVVDPTQLMQGLGSVPAIPTLAPRAKR